VSRRGREPKADVDLDTLGVLLVDAKHRTIALAALNQLGNFVGREETVGAPVTAVFGKLSPDRQTGVPTMLAKDVMFESPLDTGACERQQGGWRSRPGALEAELIEPSHTVFLHWVLAKFETSRARACIGGTPIAHMQVALADVKDGEGARMMLMSSPLSFLCGGTARHNPHWSGHLSVLRDPPTHLVIIAPSAVGTSTRRQKIDDMLGIDSQGRVDVPCDMVARALRRLVSREPPPRPVPIDPNILDELGAQLESMVLP
jgi:hypothetical protein